MDNLLESIKANIVKFDTLQKATQEEIVNAMAEARVFIEVHNKVSGLFHESQPTCAAAVGTYILFLAGKKI